MKIQKIIKELKEREQLQPLIQAGLMKAKVIKYSETVENLQQTGSVAQTCEEMRVSRSYVYLARDVMRGK